MTSGFKLLHLYHLHKILIQTVESVHIIFLIMYKKNHIIVYSLVCYLAMDIFTYNTNKYIISPKQNTMMYQLVFICMKFFIRCSFLEIYQDNQVTNFL